MSNLNVVALVGNLTRDPESRQAGDTTVANLRVAVNSRAKVNGEWTEKPNYFHVSVFGQAAEFVTEYGAKGRQVSISGRLDWREWEDKEGNKRQSVSIIANDVSLIGPRQEAQEVESADDAPSPF